MTAFDLSLIILGSGLGYAAACFIIGKWFLK